jgi:hypothetical protein
MKTDTLQPATDLHSSAPPSLEALLNRPNPADTALAPRSDAPSAPVPDAPSMSVAAAVPGTLARRKPRNGKIARLPKPVRDVVNRMLFNRIPQERIVAALDEIEIHVTQRNISNWKTRGGYREWRLAQEHAIQLHLHQDNLVDLIRRHDGSELPEVGLQAAATQLSQFFLTPAAAQLLASDPKAYDLRVATLARISSQLKALQKYRDDCARNLGYEHDPARIRHETNGELEKLRQNCSSEIGESARDPDIPHRNELPNRDELFHVAPPPPQPRFTSLQELKELLRGQAKSGATPEGSQKLAEGRVRENPRST